MPFSRKFAACAGAPKPATKATTSNQDARDITELLLARPSLYHRFFPPQQARAQFYAPHLLRQSPSTACTSVSAATAAVSARRMRADTAAVAALTLVQAVLGDWRNKCGA